MLVLNIDKILEKYTQTLGQGQTQEKDFLHDFILSIPPNGIFCDRLYYF